MNNKRLNKFYKNLELLNDKFNGNTIMIDSDNYIKYTSKTNFKCHKHDLIFESSLHILLDKRVNYGCPLCKKEKLSESGIKGTDIRWHSNNIGDIL